MYEEAEWSLAEFYQKLHQGEGMHHSKTRQRTDWFVDRELKAMECIVM